MGRIADLRVKLYEADAVIRAGEIALARNPSDEGMVVNILSAKKVRDRLELEFRKAAAAIQNDVCSYRVFGDSGRESARAFATSLLGFQKLYSSVFDALKNGRKQRVALSQEIANITDFGFAYSFSGSVGAVLTLPNYPELWDTRADSAISMVFDMAKAPDTTHISDLVRTLGPAPVSALYQWVKSNADMLCGIDIKWERLSVVKSRLFMDETEMAAMTALLRRGGEPTTEERDVFGLLRGIDVGPQTFTMVVGDETIAGALQLESPVDAHNTAKVPAMYHARIKTTSRELYYREEPQTDHVLLRLKSVS